MAGTPAELNQALYALRDYLENQRERGRELIDLAPESLDKLDRLPGALMKMLAPDPAPATESVREETPKSTVAAETVIPLSDIDPPADSVPAMTLRGIEILSPEGDTKRDKLNNLFRMAKACKSCRGLGSLRDQMVFATGNPEADLMIVGEAPGAEEEKQKKPFVGPAGQKLDGIMKAMGFAREDLYISNIVKFRPMIGDGRFQGPKNRKPTPEEMAASVKYVLAEIQIVKPKVIIACGGTAAEGLLDLGGSVSSMRGKFYDLSGTPVMVTYHPSYILRAESDADGGRPKKRMVWEDMLKVMEKMGLPISEKQRNFFT